MQARIEARVCPTESLIGAGTVVTGDIRFSGGLRIDGEVRGTVRALDMQAGTLVIGEKGRVAGDIQVARLVVNGQIAGRAEASEVVRLQSRARIEGDIEYAAAEIHSGAVIQGDLLQRPGAGQTAEFRAATPTPLARLAPATASG